MTDKEIYKNIELLNERKHKKRKKKNPYNTTYTTGNQQYNIDMFNKMLAGKAIPNSYDGLPRTGFDSVDKNISNNCGTFISQSIDGGNSVDLSSTSAGGSESADSISEQLEILKNQDISELIEWYLEKWNTHHTEDVKKEPYMNKINEAKRQVRRYYIRPQHIWAASKKDILKALTFCNKNHQNCSVYTLNNLEDNNDITKLTNKDIIYYFDDGKLYDKNHVPVLDYDLFVKHEEKRRQFNTKNTPDNVFKNNYSDRITDKTLDETLFLDFIDVNASSNQILEGKELNGFCCICGEKIDGYGNNAEPYAHGTCCDSCNTHFVIPKRIELWAQEK